MGWGPEFFSRLRTTTVASGPSNPFPLVLRGTVVEMAFGFCVTAPLVVVKAEVETTVCCCLCMASLEEAPEHEEDRAASPPSARFSIFRLSALLLSRCIGEGYPMWLPKMLALWSLRGSVALAEGKAGERSEFLTGRRDGLIMRPSVLDGSVPKEGTNIEKTK